MTMSGDHRSGRPGQGLPSFEEIRSQAYRQLGDAADWLRSDWSPLGSELTDAQAEGRREALRLIGQAKAALNRVDVHDQDPAPARQYENSDGDDDVW